MKWYLRSMTNMVICPYPYYNLLSNIYTSLGPRCIAYGIIMVYLQY